MTRNEVVKRFKNEKEDFINLLKNMKKILPKKVVFFTRRVCTGYNLAYRLI